MKKSVVLGKNTVLCPCCGYSIIVDATVRLKGEPKAQKSLEEDMTQYARMDDNQLDAVNAHLAKEEAERHG